MANQAIGMIETKGYVPALSAADAMVKAANVEIVSRNEVGGGLVSVIVKGDVVKNFGGVAHVSTRHNGQRVSAY